MPTDTVLTLADSYALVHSIFDADGACDEGIADTSHLLSGTFGEAIEWCRTVKADSEAAMYGAWVLLFYNPVDQPTRNALLQLIAVSPAWSAAVVVRDTGALSSAERQFLMQPTRAERREDLRTMRPVAIAIHCGKVLWPYLSDEEKQVVLDRIAERRAQDGN